MSTHERESELSAYLLGELGAEERAAFERALAGDDALRAEVERLRPVVARLDALPVEGWEAAPEPPPLRLPSGALAGGGAGAAAEVPAAGAPVAAPAAPKPAAAPRPERRRRWLRGPLVVRPAFAALGAAALLALGIALGTLIDSGGSGSTSSTPTVAAQQRTVPLQPLQAGAPAHGRALVADAGGQQRVTLRLRGLPPSRAHQFYEVWLMDASGPLIAIGSFRVGADGSATVKLPLPVPATRYQYFDISVQPEGDDANHSGDSVLRGATA